MAVISLTIEEADYEIVSGVPAFVTFSTNIPASVFYTLDGTDPTTSSLIAVGEVALPTQGTLVTLKVFATNGVDSSPIIKKCYGTTIAFDRRPHDTVKGLNSGFPPSSPFPFGSFSQPKGVYGNTGGLTIKSAGVTGVPDGYDGQGNPAGFTNKPFNIENYEIIFSETNVIGQMGRGIGNLPSDTFVIPSRTDPPESSETNSPFFNPKALVIYQDGTKPSFDPAIEPMLRSSFSLFNPERVRDGNYFFTTGLDGNTPTTHTTKSMYNPKDNTMMYYYRDRESNRWIISKTKFVNKDPGLFNLGGLVFGRYKDSRYVYPWITFLYNKLA